MAGDHRISELPALAAALAANPAHLALVMSGAAPPVTQSMRFDVLTGALARLQGYKILTDPKYGTADPSGVASSAAALQNAADDAGVGGRVYIPPGKYAMKGSQITGYLQQVWEGGYQFGTGGIPGTDGRSCLVWDSTLGAGSGVVAGVNQVFRRVMFQGVAKGTTTGSAISQGTSAQSNHSKYDWCQFYDWGRGLTVTNGFYASFDTCEWARCGIGVVADTCYNMHFVNCTARCWDNVVSQTGGVFVDALTQIRHLAIHGGAIEGFSSSGAIVLAAGGSLVDVLGVYFESSVVGSNAFGVDVRADGSTVTALGNLVYLTELNRWINMSGRDHCVLVSRGNHFVCAGSSTSNPVGYVLPSGASSFIDIGPDNWNDVGLAGAAYVSSINSPIANHSRVIAPAEWNSSLNAVEVKGRPMWLVAQSAPPSAPISGTIAQADRATWNPIGAVGVDPYPVIWDGARWNPVSRPTFFGSKTYDPPNLTAGSWTTALTTITTNNAQVGDKVDILFSLDTAGVKFFGRVTAGGIVTVDAWNPTAGGIDLASGTITAVATRY